MLKFSKTMETFYVSQVSLCIFVPDKIQFMREKILEKAGKMFLNYGFKSITMDDIANEIGISKKTIYKYFANKVELVDASTEVVQKTIETAITEITEKKLNAIEENFAIKTVFQNMFKKAKTSPMFQLKKYYLNKFFY